MEQSHYHMMIEQLLAVLQQPQPEARAAAVEKLSASWQHAVGLEALCTALHEEKETRVNCQTCQEFLPAIIEASEPDFTLSPAMHASVLLHMACCPQCFAEYTMLREVNALAGTPAVHFPAPDLSFLAPGWVPARGWLYQLWRQGSEISRIVLRLGEVPPPAMPAPLAVKSTGYVEQTQKKIVQQVTLTPDDADDLDIEAVIWHLPEDALHYMLTVRVQVPSRWPDLAGTEVHATAAEWQAEGTTDVEGMVQFKGMPAVLLNRLTITVSP